MCCLMSAAMPKLTTLILYVCNNISDSFGVSVLKICLFLNMCVYVFMSMNLGGHAWQ